MTLRTASTSLSNDAALVRTLARWERTLRRLQRRHPERWDVPGWSTEEVRDALTLHVLELERGAAPADLAEGDVGVLRALRRRVLELRARCRLGATPTDFSEEPVADRHASHEARYFELEEGARFKLAEERAGANLNRPQRQWLAAMQFAAVCGEFFESSDRLNLSAASRVLGKNRSSAQRAYRELQQHFQRERERLG